MKFVWDIANGELKDVKTQTFGEKFSIAGMDRDLNIPTKVAEVDKDLYQDFNWPGHMIHESEGGQLGQEEYYRRESIPHSERPITGKDGGLIRQGYQPGGPPVSLGVALGRPVVLRALAAMGITAAAAQKMAEENPSMLNNILANLFSGPGKLDPSAFFEDTPTEGPEVEKVEEDWTPSFKDEKPPKLPKDPVPEVLQDVAISELIDKYRKLKTKKGSTQPTMKDYEKTELINKVVDTFKKQNDRLPSYSEMRKFLPTWNDLSKIIKENDIKILPESEYRALSEVKEKAKEAKLNPEFLAKRRKFFQNKAEQDKTITVVRGKVEDPNIISKDAEVFFPKTITYNEKTYDAKKFFMDNLLTKAEHGARRKIGKTTLKNDELAKLYNTNERMIEKAISIIRQSS